MTTIGFIGSGKIGQAVARAVIAAGHQVVMSNSRGPDTLTDLVADLGPQASADTAEGAARQGEVVVVAIPFHTYRDVPAAPLEGRIVIDTTNYYPGRDGHVTSPAERSTTSSQMLAEHLRGSSVVKAFNHIESRDIIAQARPRASEDRRALAIAGGEAATATVATVLDEIGFDVVVLGDLSESWRIEPGTPGFGPRLDVAGMREALAAAAR